MTAATSREAMAMSWLDRAIREATLSSLSGELVDPIHFCKTNGIEDLHRFVLSHPDADHMAGLRRILSGELPALNFWDIPHSRVHSGRGDFKTDAAYDDWRWYEALRGGKLQTQPKVLNPVRGDANQYWIDDDIEILSPTGALVEACDDGEDWNNGSYVLKIHHGPSSVLLPGDIESKAWNDMISAGVDLSADVLVASHHGRSSGYSEDAMQAIAPAVVIISTAKLDPGVDAEDDYRSWTPNVYSTREDGTIWVRMYDNGCFEIQNQDRVLASFSRETSA
jgi:competence protein ComEC